MRHLFPVYCRPVGYLLALLSIFLPMFLFLLGKIDNEGFLTYKKVAEFLIFFSLFLVFFSKQTKEEIGEPKLRLNALIWGGFLGVVLSSVLFIIRLFEPAILSNITSPWICGICIVFCLELFCKKTLIEKRMRERK